MSDPRGLLRLTAGGKEYRLWVGMSVIADMQAKHGDEFFRKLEPPEGAPSDWLPSFGIIVDMMLAALERYHADEADRFLVDEILAEHPQAFMDAIAAAFPDAQPGKARARRKA